MSQLKEPLPGNLTIAVMYRDTLLFENVKKELEERFGPVDIQSEAYSFSDISPYYDEEMGEGISKIVLSFRDLLHREKVKEVKLAAVEIEERYTQDGNRMINLDPGLVTSENFLLTTGKNYSHRIYLGSGVFAEVTLMFGKKGVIRELPWTYRDYLYEPARSFLLTVRSLWKQKTATLKK